LLILRLVGSPPLHSQSENPPSPAVLTAWVNQLKSRDAFAQIHRHP
jgi:hypothetical protein